MWNKIICTLLTLAALALTGPAAWGESTWTVEVTSHDSSTHKTTFTITRPDKTHAQTVRYRTVGLSAYAGQNFTGTSGSISFGVNEPSKTVTVTEHTPAINAYWLQSTGTSRSYNLEVTDQGGYLLAKGTRIISTGTGTQLSTEYLNTGIVGMTYFDRNGDGSLLVGNMSSASGSAPIKYRDVAHSGSAGTWVKVTDGGYKQGVHTMSTDDLYGSSSKIRTFLDNQGTKMYATVYFTQKEENDGYQYIQIYSGSNYDSGDDPNADVNDPVNSLYKACFILSYEESGSVETTPHTQFFPHRWDYVDRKTQYNDNKWSWQEFDYDNAHLYVQKFKTATPSYRAENSGSLVLRPTVSSLNVRFDAGGSYEDDWYFKDLKLRLALVDANAPTVLERSVAPGRHAKGNTLYLSVAFSEPVTITGSTKKLATNWGDLAYLSGSGTNVLTFSGTIQSHASATLSVSGLTGTIADLAGNTLSGSVNADGLCPLDNNDLSPLSKDGSGRYLITSANDLSILSSYVNDGHSCAGLTFLQTADIAFSHTTAWDDASSTEHNFNTIGYYYNDEYRHFEGTYDGGDHTISGIRIYKGGFGDADKSLGLFAYVYNGTVRNVNLVDTRITGYYDVGGIVGILGYDGHVEDCTVAADVCIHNVFSGCNRGGIVGVNWGGVLRCISRARFTNKSGITPTPACFGGIVGDQNGTVSDCIAIGAVIPAVHEIGAIVGLNKGTLTRNYYYNCKVASDVVTPSGVGQGCGQSTTMIDADGTQPLYAVTLPAHASLVRTGTNLPGTGYAVYENGADIAGVPYARASSTLILTYDSAAITQGYDVVISVTETSSGNPVTVTDNGNHTYTIASMPAANITVIATLLPLISYIDADGNEQSHTCTPIVSSTSNVSLGSSGQTNWYSISDNVTIDGRLSFNDSHSHVIVLDGAHLTVNGTSGYHAFRNPNGSITIYGQNEGSGTITVNAYSSDYVAIQVKGVTINGGIVDATGQYGISAVNANVTINRGTVTANGSLAGIKGNTITLGCATEENRITASGYIGTVKVAAGQTLTDGNSAHSYSNTLNSDQIAAIAGKTLMKALGPVNYLDENGTEQTCSNYTILADSTIPIDDNNRGTIGTSNQDTWYVATGNYTFNHSWLTSLGHVHLILCDGANFTVSGSIYGILAQSLTIYGQREGTGCLVVKTTDANDAQGAINYIMSLTMNGGYVSTSTEHGNGIHCIGGSSSRLTINGGNVNAIGTAYGISCNGETTLGWTRAADQIYASSYDCKTIRIKDGQTFSNGSEVLSGTITDMTKVDGKTLVPYIAAEQTLNLTAHQATLAGQTRYWTTFYHPTANYELPAGAQAFYMGSDHALYRIGAGSIIPAHCAVVIMAESASVEITVSNDAAPSVTGNILQGTSAAIAAPTGAHVMSQVGETFGFFEYTGTDSIPANKAYYVE